MIYYETTAGIQTRTKDAYWALVNWFVDQVEQTRPAKHKSKEVYVATQHEEFLCQVVGMIERQFQRAPNVSIRIPPHHQYQTLLRFLYRYGDIRRLEITED